MLGSGLVQEVRQRVDRLELGFNPHGVDPYGISKKHLVRMFAFLGWLYRHHLTVRAYGTEHVPDRGRAMLVGNHSGGIALDGAMVLASMLLEKDPPRLAQGMAEKFLAAAPFLSEITGRTGQFTGLPEHALRLLEDERLLLVFPEGARGTAKLYRERHSLVRFGTGFARLALQTGTPVVPFAFIGGGEAIPTIMNLYRLGRLVGAPYVPVTPYLVPVPRRVPCEIYFAPPVVLEGDPDGDDDAIEEQVERVKSEVARLIDLGVARRAAGTAEQPLDVPGPAPAVAVHGGEA